MSTSEIEDARVSNAKRASDALGCATIDRDPAMQTMTTVGSLTGIKIVIDDLATSLHSESLRCERLTKALQRINTLKVRAARETIERRDWKQMTYELQAIAESALLTMSLRS